MADKKFTLPKTQTELDALEAKGFWKAIVRSREIAVSKSRITTEVILDLHNLIFKDAIPDIAGRFRVEGEDINPLECIEPPLGGRLVAERMHIFWREFDTRISSIKPLINEASSEAAKRLEDVVDLAAWAQHQMTAIHPFGNGNGRMARILTNMVLLRFGLPPSPIKIEGENKSNYLASLCRIDEHDDYRPLKNIILKGITEALEKEEKARRRNGTL